MDHTIRDALQWGRIRLQEAGINEPLSEARLLLGHACGLSREEMVASPEKVLSPSQTRVYGELLGRRSLGEPFAKIIGFKEFWGLRFHVTQDTLDPRPDSEALVEGVLAHFNSQKVGRQTPVKILDLGTGSGCLLLSLLHEYPEAMGIGVDKSFQALKVARENAIALGLEGRASFMVGDWGQALGAAFDLVVCNPPYIAAHEWQTLSLETRHDPKEALIGGPTGLEPYGRVLKDVPGLLSSNGLAAFEIGYDQEKAICRLAKQNGMNVLTKKEDLSGRVRVVLMTAKT